VSTHRSPRRTTRTRVDDGPVNVALWVVAIVAGAISFAAAVNKLMQSKADLLKQENMAWANDFSDATITRIGAVEMLGVFGLIVPQATGIAEILTPIAAVGLILLQVGATMTHLRRSELRMLTITVPLILALAYVAIGRFIHG
jgi:DoxX-like family